LAGEIAARTAKGPGSLHAGLYDALAGLTEESLRAGLRIEVARQ
jgi:hydroxyethylthiazole kinase